MAFEKLQITGPAYGHYQLGDPMHVHDRGFHLGTLDPVWVNRDATEVHISRFKLAPELRNEKCNFGPLVLLEVTALLADRFHAVQTVSFSLTREIETHGDGTMVASERSALLHAIGAHDVTIRPRPDSTTPGNFVVQGVWAYNPRNLEALKTQLRRERELYREADVDLTDAAPGSGLRDRLRRWLRRGEDAPPG